VFAMASFIVGAVSSAPPAPPTVSESASRAISFGSDAVSSRAGERSRVRARRCADAEMMRAGRPVLRARRSGTCECV
jgi:hypothetical protein